MFILPLPHTPTPANASLLPHQSLPLTEPHPTPSRCVLQTNPPSLAPPPPKKNADETEQWGCGSNYCQRSVL